MESNVISIFKTIAKADVVKESSQILIERWKYNNQVISDDFHTLSVFKKQEVLDQMLKVSSELYEMIINIKYGITL